MAEKKLREFFQQKFAKAGPGKVNWQARKDSWIQAIDDLYEKITKVYLASSINDKTVGVSYADKRVIEPFIGVYVVKEMELLVGDEMVVLSPKGTNIVGATGRIGLRGDMGEATIIRQPGDRWGVVLSRTPTLRIVPLNEESLLAALKMVMRR